jgi:hypothetical protein
MKIDKTVGVLLFVRTNCRFNVFKSSLHIYYQFTSMTYDVQILKTKYCEIIIIKSGVLIFNLNHENKNPTKYNVSIDCCCNV